MRARNIKPGFYRDKTLVKCSIPARLMVPGLWMLADREGRFKDDPDQIRMDIFPCDFSPEEVDGFLNELADAGHIERYEAGGQRLIQVRNFARHQNPHKQEKSSGLPGPSGQNEGHPEITGPDEKLHDQPGSVEKLPDEHHTRPADSLNPDSLNPDSLSHTGRDGEREFSEFWGEVAPLFRGTSAEAAARGAWLEAFREGMPELPVVIAAAKKQARLFNPGFEPKVETWIGKRSWNAACEVKSPEEKRRAEAARERDEAQRKADEERTEKDREWNAAWESETAEARAEYLRRALAESPVLKGRDVDPESPGVKAAAMNLYRADCERAVGVR